MSSQLFSFIRHPVNPTLRTVSLAAQTAVAALAALAAAMGIGRFAFTPILPMMQQDAGVSLAQGAWLASANYLGYLGGALSAIGLRARPASAIRAGLALIAVATLAMGLTRDLLAWAALRALAGVASAWVLVFVSTWALERLAALGRPGLSGAAYAGVGAGVAVAGVACVALMAAQAGSAAAWMTLGAGALAVTALLWNSFEAEGPAAAAPAPPRDAKRWALVLCYGLFGFGYIVPATFLPVMARQTLGETALFGWAWPVFGLAAAASTLIASRLAQSMRPRALWIAGSLLMALGVATPLFLPGLAGIALAALLVGGTFMVVTMAGMQEARRVAGAQARTLMAAMTAAFALGQIAGPLAVGFLAGTQGGFARALGLAAGALALSAAALAKDLHQPAGTTS